MVRVKAIGIPGYDFSAHEKIITKHKGKKLIVISKAKTKLITLAWMTTDTLKTMRQQTPPLIYTSLLNLPSRSWKDHKINKRLGLLIEIQKCFRGTFAYNVIKPDSDFPHFEVQLMTAYGVLCI